MRTGVFFHYQEGERLRDFPQALTGLLERPNIFLYDAFYPLKPRASYELEPVPQDLLLKVHSPEMLAQVKSSPLYQTALFSAGGTLQAADTIFRGEIDNAFVFTGCGDHHAGRDFFGGWCYLNGAALAIAHLREKFGARRLAILDTDAHHGDGTWDLFRNDREVLYLCLCPAPDQEENSKVNIHIPFPVSDEVYLDRLKVGLARLRDFRPQLLFWNWGYDGTRGEYGDLGLSPAVHLQMARDISRAAGEAWEGRVVVVLCGGSGRALARQLIPSIIACLAGVL